MTTAPPRSRALVLPDPKEKGRDPVIPIIVGAAFAVANDSALTGGHLRFLGPALVFWLMLLFPAYLLATTDLWGKGSVAERLSLGLVGALFLLLVGGLAINTVLPLLGVARPLATVPVLLLVDVIDAGLWLFRRRRPALFGMRLAPGLLGALETRVLALGGACVLLMVLGANRLNNGNGDALTMIGLGVALLTLALLLLWAGRLRAGVTGGAVYLLSAALLLMTSLRGWSVTGHDIQLEYRVFQLTAAQGKWDMSTFRDPYNACLSITLLPTQMASLLHVDDPYIYKVFFQLLFAACPVMVFTLARRYFSDRVAILAVAYFIGFPTFFTDLPFLNRQEMALLFVAAAFLAMTNPLWRKRRRQLVLVAAAVGAELCHYSSSYVLFGTLAVAWLGQMIFARGWPPAWTRSDPLDTPEGRWASATTRTVGLGCLAAILAVIVAWGGLATKTADGVTSEFNSAVSTFLHHGGGAKSASVNYGLFSGGGSNNRSQLNQSGSNHTLLDQYRDETLAERAKADPGTFIPLTVVDRYQTPTVPQPNLPVTRAGHALSRVGVSPTTVNDVIRSLAAKGEQVFLLIGMLGLLLSKRWRSKAGREYYYLCAAAIVVLVAVTVLPDLSVEYGVLRVFQQALILVAPVIVVGSLTLFQPLGRRWRQALAGGVGLAFFASTTGLIPQALGGYPAQLNLNNSGQYYDLYYMTPQQEAAVNWLAGKPGTLPGGVQSDFTSQRFAFNSPSSVTGRQYLTDLFPTFVERGSWVIADASMLATGTASVFVNGNIITYRYPFALLNNQKNVVFDDGKTKVYQ